MNNTIEIKKCQHCGTTDELRVNSRRKNKDGDTVVYYMCLKDRTEARKKLYRKNWPLQRANIYRYRAKLRAAKKAAKSI